MLADVVEKLIKYLEKSGTGYTKILEFQEVAQSVGESCMPMHLLEHCKRMCWPGTEQKIHDFLQRPEEKTGLQKAEEANRSRAEARREKLRKQVEAEEEEKAARQRALDEQADAIIRGTANKPEV